LTFNPLMMPGLKFRSDVRFIPSAMVCIWFIYQRFMYGKLTYQCSQKKEAESFSEGGCVIVNVTSEGINAVLMGPSLVPVKKE
jgi:hypothetical protein